MKTIGIKHMEYQYRDMVLKVSAGCSLILFDG